jgi:aspartate kinase
MQVFKFGGASVKDAEAVINVAKVLKQVHKDSKLCVVISAMGKTTNALEELTNAFFYHTGNPSLILDGIKKFHFDICNQLFSSTTHPIYQDLENTFVELHWSIEDEPTHSYDFEYDQIISIGEVLSTKIVSAYLNSVNVNNTWIDARGLIQTDNTYRDAVVDFNLTESKAIMESIFLFSRIFPFSSVKINGMEVLFFKIKRQTKMHLKCI